jgi:hypothetical protein
MAHAVGDHAALLRAGRYHLPAGTHAEAVNIATVLAVMHQLVIGRAQGRIAGMLSQATDINHVLRVFDAKADGKGFRFDMYATVMQHFKGITRAVADGEDDMIGGDEFTVRETQS